MMLSKSEGSIHDESKVEEPPTVESTNDREKELERRLAMLGVATEDEHVPKTEAEPEPVVDLLQPTPEAKDDVAIEESAAKLEDSLLELPAPAPTKPADPVVVEEKPKETAAPKTNKSALLARIMAAQERAKQAQTKISSEGQDPFATVSIAAEKEKMMKALNPQLAENEVQKSPAKTPVMNNMPPPPPFEVLEQQQVPAPAAFQAPSLQQFQAPPPPAPMQFQPPPAPAAQFQPPPPPFEAVEDIFQQTPSAPPVEESPDLLGGLTPMAPPPFESTYTQESTGLMTDMDTPAVEEGFDFDVDGNHLSPEEKRKMIEEQRAIMEQIQKQARQNAASVAAVRADAFEQRSNIAAAAAAGRVTPPTHITDPEELDQFDADRRLAEQLQRQFDGASGNVSAPVIQEETSQMDADRKMAEELQRQFNQADEQAQAAAQGYPGARRGAASAAPKEKSWWDSISSALGVAEEETGPRSAEINVNRPPGSQRRLHNASVDHDDSDLHLEREGLLGGGAPVPPRYSAQVAEQKPLFSCVVDSISSTANAVGDSITSYTYGEEEEVHGVDTTSFLAVGNVGRDNSSSGGGSYHAVPGND